MIRRAQFGAFRCSRIILACLALGAVLCGVTGCFVLSLNPFYEEQDLFFEPALLGRWKGDGQAWRFEPAKHEAKAYHITYADGNGKESQMAGRLFKLADQWFLDLFGRADSEVMPPPIPSHYVVRLQLEDGNLVMQGLNYEWLADWLKKNPKALRHQWRVNPGDDPDERYFVLTAETADLQEFLRKQLKNEAAWSNPVKLQRPDAR